MSIPSERPFLSHFSPQWTRPEYLEEILVQRGDLLAESVSMVRDGILASYPKHLLFVGPRGAGKTHFVTLVQHRLAKDAELADRMRIAWLSEDETATSFLKLLIAIYRCLSERYPSEFSASTLAALNGKEPAVAQEQLTHALRRDLGGRMIVCIMENVDSLFRSLNKAEQRNWRAFLQNNQVVSTVGTAQTLFNGIADHDEPFFGFFDTRHFKPLTSGEARDLLERIATLHDRPEVAEFLRTPTGRARVDAIRALAGGNPRLYLIFSDLLVNASVLDDLVRPFEEIVDRQLTSYYQERLRWLSAQQREIIQQLCRSRSPMPVKQIAEALFTSANSITGQLKLLREMRYVDSHPLGREVLYELAEPLMRLALQVKETHDRRPLALIVDFLRVWHEPKELQDRLADCPEVSPARPYWETAYKLLKKLPISQHELLDDDALGRFDESALGKARFLAEEPKNPAQLFRRSGALIGRKESDQAVTTLTQIVELENLEPNNRAVALLTRAIEYHFRSKHEACLQDCRQLFSLDEQTIRKNIEFDVVYAWAIVLNTFAVTTLPDRWTAILLEFAGHFTRFDILTELGEAAVQHLPTLAASPLNHAAWDAWGDAWEAAQASLPEKDRDKLDIPLRLLRAGIAWLKTKDPAHLLTLPLEERRILREALKLPEEKQ